jgi:putative membrane protein
MLKRIATMTVLFGSVGLVAAGCAPEDEAFDDQEELAPPAAEVPGATTPTEATFADEAIVRVLDTVNTGEIAEAELATEQAQDEEVRRFAEMMITDHSQLSSRAPSETVDATTSGDDPAGDAPATSPTTAPQADGAAAGTPNASVSPAQPSGVDMQESPEMLIQRLRSESQAVQEELQGLTGEAFDRAYIERQVVAHQGALDLIDAQLLPNAEATELRETLEAARPVIASHLEEARRIQQRLGTGDASEGGTGGTSA